MSKSFKPISFQRVNVGKRIKATKTRISWRFEIDSKEHQIDLFISRLSGKRKILLDNDLYTTEKKSSSVYGNYPVKVGKRMIVVFEVDDSNTFDLRLNNISFQAFYNSMKLQVHNTFSAFPDPEPEKPHNLKQPKSARDHKPAQALTPESPHSSAIEKSKSLRNDNPTRKEALEISSNPVHFSPREEKYHILSDDLFTEHPSSTKPRNFNNPFEDMEESKLTSNVDLLDFEVLSPEKTQSKRKDDKNQYRKADESGNSKSLHGEVQGEKNAQHGFSENNWVASGISTGMMYPNTGMMYTTTGMMYPNTGMIPMYPMFTGGMSPNAQFNPFMMGMQNPQWMNQKYQK